MTSARLLLDTNALLWLLDGDPRLGPGARDAVESADTIAVSVGSLWEIAIKQSLGKLVVPPRLPAALRDLGLDRLDIGDGHLAAVAVLPMHHRDPFDRLLISQAMVDGLAIVTADQAFQDYDVQVVDTRS